MELSAETVLEAVEKHNLQIEWKGSCPVVEAVVRMVDKEWSVDYMRWFVRAVSEQFWFLRQVFYCDAWPNTLNR